MRTSQWARRSSLWRLAGLVQLGAVLFLASPALAQQAPAFAPIEAEAAKVLTGVCGQCHASDVAIRTNPDYARGPAENTVIGDPGALADFSIPGLGPVVPGNPKDSDLIRQVAKKRAGGNGMPKGAAPPLNDEQFAALVRWVSCMPESYDPASPPATCAPGGIELADAYLGGAAPPATGTQKIAPVEVAVATISVTEVISTIARDLMQIDRARRGDTRYLLLTNLHNQGVDQKQMDVYRAGLARGLNSLSTRSDMAPLVAIDDAQTIYRVYLSDLGWTAYEWDALMAEYPYAGVPSYDPLAPEGQDVLRSVDDLAGVLGVSLLAQGDFPYELQVFARADWLMRVGTHPGRYEKLLKLPHSEQELESELLGVDPEAEIFARATGVVRGGFPADNNDNDSGVSEFSRIIERHSLPGIRDGYYWKSFDFGPDNSGTFAVPATPMRVEELSHQAANAGLGFVHDGGEMVFSLPNGLQGYFITTVKGTPLPSAPNDIVNLSNNHFDGKALPTRKWEYLFLKRFRNAENGAVISPTDRDIFNGLSCMACHSDGMKRNTDVVGDYFSDLMGNSVSTNYTAQDIDLIRFLYNRERLDAAFDRDGATFGRAAISAYRAIGLSESSPGWPVLVGNAANGQLGDFDPVTALARAYETNITTPLSAPPGSDRKRAALQRLASEVWLDAATLSSASTSTRLTVAAFAGRAQSNRDQIQRETGSFSTPDVLGEGPFECQFALLAFDLRWIGTRTELRNALSDNGDICRRDSYAEAAPPAQQHDPGPGKAKPVDKPYAPPPLSRNDLVSLSPEKQQYREGEEIRLNVTVHQACYLTIIDIDPQNVGTVLFPNRFITDNYVPAASSFTIPRDEDPFVWKLTPGSKGIERIIAVCDPTQRDVEGIKHDFVKEALTTVKVNAHLGVEVLARSPGVQIEIGVIE